MFKQILKKNSFLKLQIIKHRLRNYQPEWSRLIEDSKEKWLNSLKKSKNGDKILIATCVGSHLPATILESMIAVALILRGAEVHILLCDRFLPACLACSVHHFSNLNKFSRVGPIALCNDCLGSAHKMFSSLGVRVHRFSTYVDYAETRWASGVSENIPINEISKYEYDGMAVGEHALAGTLRFFARGSFSGQPNAEPIFRRFFNAALLSTIAAKNLFSRNRFKTAVFHHGIYVPQGLIGEVCRKMGVGVVNWNPAYRRQCFIFTHHDTYHHELLKEPTSLWENIEWDKVIETKTLEYLKSRWYGTKDWIYFHENPCEELDVIAKELGVDFSKPCIGMLSNVVWDAQLHYRANAFSGMLNWVERTIQYFINRPELQLIIRIHPAELSGGLPSRQLLLDEIRALFPKLPQNIFIIPPQSNISTYAAMLQCNAVLIYGTKTGVELTSLGIPVIVAGEAWIRNKGLTFDANSAEEYFAHLDRLPFNSKLPDHVIRRAQKYAFHFFFRRMIPLEFIIPQPGSSVPYRLGLERLKDLNSERDHGLNVICNGILTGNEFVYRFEKFI